MKSQSKSRYCLAILVLVLSLIVARLYFPRTHVVLERTSDEKELREGRTFTHFLSTANWTTLTSDNAPMVDSMDEVPTSFGPPAFYRLSDAGLKEQCPPEIFEPHAGGIEFALKIFNNTPKVAIFPKKGVNAVGCHGLTWVDSQTVIESADKGTLSLEQYALYFDGHLHKNIQSGQHATLQSAHVVSNFFSNFTEIRLTAPMHAAMVSSKVVVCTGTKIWFFMEPDCCNTFGHHFLKGGVIGKGFPPYAKITAVLTRPGDILTFGSFHHHIVVTEPGPSFMQTYRLLRRDVVAGGLAEFGFSFARAFFECCSD